MLTFSLREIKSQEFSWVFLFKIDSEYIFSQEGLQVNYNALIIKNKNVKL